MSLYERSLRRAQLRWSLASVVTVVVPLLALPLLAVLAPAAAALPLLGVPLGWWLLAVAVYPAIWLAGRRHVTGAERTEDDYRELVGDQAPDGSDGPVPGPR